MKSVVFSGLAFLGLSACLSFDPTDSSFATPNSSGVLNEVNSSSGVRSGSEFSAITGNGYGYQVGGVSGQGLQGFAGLVPGATVTTPTSTTATFDGEFEVAVIDFILTSSGGEVSGSTTLDRGDINLQADFAAGTLTGGGTGLDGGFSNFILNENPLTVNGQIEGTTLTGNVSYNGLEGSLRGLVGGNEAVGAFHGHDDGNVFAGGFIAN